ncbi:hypothetical protein HYT23_04355 [Candidatus Pacearchaeota archaeon]|nr:hypothetical protein [Candidatus Pacearchaeota archaeon]
MESAKENYEKAIVETPKLKAEIKNTKTQLARHGDVTYHIKTNSNDPGYFISVEAQLTKYADIPQPMSEDKKPFFS